jgi:ParB/RepB/Spo0J family partition protein
MSTTTKTKKMWASPNEICRNEAQPRLYFAKEELVLLGESLERKQQQPITVVPWTSEKRPEVKWKIVDGERRWRAATAKGLERLWIVVDEDVGSEAEMHTASFAANWCRAGHTHAETAHAIEVEVQAGKDYEEIARLVGKSPTWAQKEHSLLKLHPEVLALMDPPTPRPDRLPSAVAYLLTGYKADKQMKLWLQHKDRGGKTAFHHIRVATGSTTRRSGAADANYVKKRAESVANMLKQLHSLPARMLGQLSGEERQKVAEGLREAAAQANGFADLLLAAVVEDDGEE